MIPPENEELNPCEPIEAKQARRDMVAARTAEFLAAGGAVRVLPSCEFTPQKYERKRLDFSKNPPFQLAAGSKAHKLALTGETPT